MTDTNRADAINRGLELTPEQRVARWKAMKAAQDRGYSIREIAREWNVSYERARQILANGPGLGRWVPLRRLEARRNKLLKQLREVTDPETQAKLEAEFEQVEYEIEAERRDLALQEKEEEDG